MQIAINCRSIRFQQKTGIGRYTANLIKMLGEIDHNNTYALYLKKGLFDRISWSPELKIKNAVLKADYFNRGPEKILRGADAYHAPSPELLSSNRLKNIVSVHDLIFKTFPKGHSQATLDTSQMQFESIVKYANKIICSSQSTLNDLKKHYSVDDKQVAMVHLGIDKSVFYQLDEEQNKSARHVIKEKGVTGPFILVVGTIEPRKNIPNILRAFSRLKKKKKFAGKLVVIGMKGWKSEWISLLIGQLDLRNDVVFMGYLSNDEVRCFYNNADVFVFPSYYEGFGFPIVEAFSCGAPVVTSNVSSCPEVAQDAALTVDPNKFDEIAGAVSKILEDKNLRAGLKEKGFKRAEDFSFLKTARKTLDVYKEVAGAS